MIAAEAALRRDLSAAFRFATEEIKKREERMNAERERGIQSSSPRRLIV